MPQITPTIDEFSRSILIVDDDRIIVQLLSAIFEKYGFKVFEASDGAYSGDFGHLNRRKPATCSN